MQVAAEAVPGCAPRVLGQHPRLGVLAMEYLPHHALWKQQLRDGDAEPRHRAGGGPHARRASMPTARRGRRWRRTSPARRSSSTSASSPTCWPPPQRTPTWRSQLRALVQATQAQAKALVHGDVSPKNILVDAHRPVFLDAECAVWGDPAFDLAFCLNHLLLKCLWTPAAAPASWPASMRWRSAYLGGRGLGGRRRAGAARGSGCCRGCCWRGWTASRRSSIWSTRRSARRCGAPARALLARPVDRLKDVALAWRRELAA